MTSNLDGAIFCIGAQKAGTSWLYRYLSQYPQLHVHKNKELHVFDNLYPVRDAPNADPAPAAVRARLEKRIANLTALEEAGTIKDWQRSRLSVFRDILDHLTTGRPLMDIVSRDAPDTARYLLDITPKYSLLNADGFRAMNALSPDVRYVFIMRDPIDRTWSHIRFQAQVAGTTPQAILSRIADDARAVYALQYWARSRYDLTLKELWTVSDPGRSHVMFYETLFRPESIRALTDFLGLPPKEPDFGKVVFATEPSEMPEDFRDLASRVLAPCYDWVRNRYGDKVPEAWTS